MTGAHITEMYRLAHGDTEISGKRLQFNKQLTSIDKYSNLAFYNVISCPGGSKIKNNSRI